MENASKAIMIAGAVLIAVALISMFIYVIDVVGDYKAQNQVQQLSNQIIASNKFFVESANDISTTRAGIQIYGYDVYNLIRKAEDINDDIDNEIEIDIRFIGALTKEGFDFTTDEAKSNLSVLEREYTYEYFMDEEGYVNLIRFSD